MRWVLTGLALLAAPAFAQLPPALERAVAAGEPPPTLRIAFVGRLETPEAWRDIQFDARRAPGDRFLILGQGGEDANLDLVLEDWRADASPDARLWADHLRGRLARGGSTRIEEGRVVARFAPALAQGDAPLDHWLADHLAGALTVSEDGRFVERITYASAAAIDLGGAKLTAHTQTYDLDLAPVYEAAFIRRFLIEGEGWIGWRMNAGALRFELFEADFHMATDSAQDLRSRP